MRGLLAGLLLLAVAPSAAAEPVVVYGVELEATGDRERLLIFAREAVRHELVERDAQTLFLDLPGTTLDPSAPSRITPGVGGSVAGVTVFERGDVAEPTVRIAIEHAPGLRPEVSRRGALLAVDFARPRPEETGGITLRFQRAELAEVVRGVARATGETILFDDALQGTVTVGVVDRVAVSEALAILEAALLMKGYALVPAPGADARAVVPIANVAARAPLRAGAPTAASDTPVTTLLRLRAAQAESVVPALSLWIGDGSTAVAHPPTNSVILAGSERRLRRLVGMVRALDEAAQEEVAVRRLRHRDAADLLELVREAHAPARIDAWADGRSNALVLRGAPDGIDAVRATLERLDRPIETGGAVRVIPVRHANPQALADLVRRAAGGAAPGVPADAGGAAARIGPQLRDLRLAVDAPTASLVATGDPLTLALLEELVGALDRQPPRIRIEVLVLGIDADAAVDLGVDFFLPLADKDPRTGSHFANILSNPRGGGLLQDASAGATDFLARYAKEPLLVPLVGPGGAPITVLVPRETALVTASGRRVDARVLARPNLLVTSGEEHTLFVGDNIPIPVSRAEQGSPLQTAQDIQRDDVGLRVRVTPTVGERGRIRLELDVEQSRLRDSLAGSVEEVGPTIAERRIETATSLADGEYLVVGLSGQSEVQRTETSPPFLRRIPVLGRLVAATTERTVRSHLLIAVRATVSRSGAEQRADSIRQRLGFERSVARVGPAFAAGDGPFALRVATTASPLEAGDVAAAVSSDERRARVVGWEWSGEPRYDVYLGGFADVATASDTALLLGEAGYAPELVVDPASVAERAHGAP